MASCVCLPKTFKHLLTGGRSYYENRIEQLTKQLLKMVEQARGYTILKVQVPAASGVAVAHATHKHAHTHTVRPCESMKAILMRADRCTHAHVFRANKRACIGACAGSDVDVLPRCAPRRLALCIIML